jgi:hypothetical protein
MNKKNYKMACASFFITKYKYFQEHSIDNNIKMIEKKKQKIVWHMKGPRGLRVRLWCQSLRDEIAELNKKLDENRMKISKGEKIFKYIKKTGENQYNIVYKVNYDLDFLKK